MNPMTIDEIHSVLWEMAQLFHNICVKHNIPYYMLGGTMLGAIRHKGFIPWDDDMDLGVPREHYDQLIEILHKELPERYEVISSEVLDKSRAYYKISDKRTHIREQFTKGTPYDLGVNIDIFVLDHCGLPNKKIEKIFKRRRLLGLIRQSHTINHDERPFYYKVFYKLLSLFYPYNKEKLDKGFQDLLNDLSTTGNEALCNFSGIYRVKEVVPKEIFGTPQLYSFETGKLYGPELAHDFLQHMYGDYMQLPPENKRHYHSTNTMWK